MRTRFLTFFFVFIKYKINSKSNPKTHSPTIHPITPKIKQKPIKFQTKPKNRVNTPTSYKNTSKSKYGAFVVVVLVAQDQDHGNYRERYKHAGIDSEME